MRKVTNLGHLVTAPEEQKVAIMPEPGVPPFAPHRYVAIYGTPDSIMIEGL